MKIEEAIKQNKPFGNNRERGIVNILYTGNWVMTRLKAILKPFGITPKQYNVLRILRGADRPISTSVIRERLLDKMADTSRLVERLNQKQLVKRTVCPSDKRLVDVSITPEGMALLEEIEASREKMDGIFSKLSSSETDQLNELLNKLRS